MKDPASTTATCLASRMSLRPGPRQAPAAEGPPARALKHLPSAAGRYIRTVCLLPKNDDTRRTRRILLLPDLLRRCISCASSFLGRTPVPAEQKGPENSYCTSTTAPFCAVGGPVCLAAA
jgi:hypothetical protein